jgi:hypothetical protein
MDGPVLSPEDARQIAGIIADLLGRIDPAALPYLALALLAAFRHKHLWLGYLTLAVLVLAGWHR